MTRPFLIPLFIALLFAASTNVYAQVPTGTPPFGSFAGGPDVIDLANLNSHFTIPVLHKPGRGTDFTYDLSYDSSVWYPVGSSGNQYWQPVYNLGWRAVTEVATGYVSANQQISSECGYWKYLGNGQRIFIATGYVYDYTNWVYHDAYGVQHPFAGLTSQSTGSCTGSPTSISPTSTDGSGYQLQATGSSGTVLSKTGTVVNAPFQQGSGSGSFIDRNGNKLTIDSSGHFYDTLSSSNPALSAAGSGTPSSPTTLSYTTSTGGAATYTLNYTNYTVATNFGSSTIHEYKSTAAVSLLTSIVLPDNSQYAFTYETTPSVPASGACTPLSGTTACVTGRIASIKLPTGGTISYSYSFSGCTSGNNGILSDGSTSCLSRTTPDGPWTYAQVKNTGAASTTTVTDPLNNQTVIQFQGIYETQRMAYQGAAGGTLLQTTNTCYTTAAPPCTGTAVTLPIQLRTVTATIPGSGGLQSQHTDKFNLYGNVTESDNYDFATAAPFPLLRQTVISYISLSGNLNAFAQTVTVKDGSGTIKSRQDTNYDQYSSFSGANCITGASQHDDTGHGCSFTARANATSTVSYTDPVTPGGAITKNFTYDSLGNLRSAQLNCCQNKSWSYSTATSYAYPDSVTSGSSSPQLTTTYTYDLNMGLVLTSTDPNNLKTTVTYDSLGRTLTSQTGSLPATSYSYVDSGTWSVNVCAPVQGSSTGCQKSILDNQGRTITTQVLDGSGTPYSATDVAYDSLGRVYKTSNPYASSPAYWTQSYFDALGRVYKMTLPDGSVSTFNFTDNTLTTTDPKGLQRKSVADGLGHLTSVYEPDPTNNNTLTLQTSYSYNVFDQLTQVTQGVQTRSYVYDTLGRVLSSTTPEGGKTCFGSAAGSTCNTDGYDNFNNLLKRTDARGVLTSYSYDGLNRLYNVSYTTTGTTAQTTSSITFSYGTNASQFNNGLLITMTDGVGSENYSYNALEQMTQLQKTVGGTTYTTQYAYNFAGELTQITYPSGRVIQQSVDAIGRLCEIAPSTTGCGSAASPYATGYGYNTASQVTGFKYGNGIYASLGFSPDRLQLNCLDYSTTNRSGACTHDSTTKFGLSYGYTSTPNNNGIIGSITDSVDNGRTVAYTYDSLARLSTALTTGSTNYPQWGLSWGYDRYGNRLNQTLTAGSGYQGSVTVSASTNQITTAGYTYDLNGNMTNDGINTLVYDAENHAVSSSGTLGSGSYTYDGNGHRVQKVSGGVTTVYVYSGSKVIAEYDGTGGVRTEHIYGGGQRVASIGLTTLANNSFESGISPSWYTSTGPGATAQLISDVTRAHSGTNYVQLYSPATSTGASVAYGSDIPVIAGNQVTFGGWVYLESGGGGGCLGWNIAVKDSSHNPIAYVVCPVPTTSGWQFQTTTYTLPTGAAYVMLYAEDYEPPSATVLRVDDGFISAGTTYYHADHLSPRMLTDGAGNIVAQQGHYPFGDPWYNATNDKLYFTTYERDAESNNDYAQARFYRWLLGRFLSLDKLSGSTSDPQSLNRYTYVENNPISLMDPSGMMECEGSDDVDCSSGGGGGGGGSDVGVGPFCLAACGAALPGYVSTSLHSPQDYSYFSGSSSYIDPEGGVQYFPGVSFFAGLPSGDVYGGVPLGPLGGGGGGNSIGSAKDLALKVLNGKNDCSKFFNNSPLVVVSANSNIPGNFTTAAQFLNSDIIQYDTNGLLPAGATAGTRETGPGATILITPNGQFDTRGGETVGGYLQGTPGAQVEILLHELAHTLLGIPSDANNHLQSWENQQKIDDNCYGAILAALQSH